MPILSGVSGNALAFSLSLVYGLGVWNQPLVRGPATVEVAATEGVLRLSREGGTCFGKTNACLTSELLLDATDAELADDAAGKHLVVEGGVVRFTADDDPDHFASGAHVGAADVHCAPTESLFDLIDPHVIAWSSITQVQASGGGGLDGLGVRLERTGRSRADASGANVACAAFDADGGVTYALLELRNLDRLGDAPGAVVGTIYDSHLEVDLDW